MPARVVRMIKSVESFMLNFIIIGIRSLHDYLNGYSSAGEEGDNLLFATTSAAGMGSVICAGLTETGPEGGCKIYPAIVLSSAAFGLLSR